MGYSTRPTHYSASLLIQQSVGRQCSWAKVLDQHAIVLVYWYNSLWVDKLKGY